MLISYKLVFFSVYTPINQNIKTNGRWTEYQWPSLYNAMFCSESMGPGVHVDVILHVTPI